VHSDEESNTAKTMKGGTAKMRAVSGGAVEGPPKIAGVIRV